MLPEPSYFFILFDVDKPKDFMCSRWKRIEQREFKMLVDKNIVEIEAQDEKYLIQERRSFYIHTTIEYSMFVIIDAKKI